MSSAITLLAINARYSHSSLGARALLATMQELRDQTHLVETNINQSLEEILAATLATAPCILGIGVYIWNRKYVEALLPAIRREAPRCRIILGGPEISYTTDSPLARSADCVVRGEGETRWLQICRGLLRGDPLPHLPEPIVPDLQRLPIPADSYTAKDLATRNIYIETSRGCPFACRFCLSSLETTVRTFNPDAIRNALRDLINRGARQIRFVDRSFNLGGQHALDVLDFLLANAPPQLRIHLEVVPDCLSPAMRERLLRFPPKTLHIETGIQSFNPQVLARMHRHTRIPAMEEGIRWLVESAKADVHADLIAGLPGESLLSFSEGFNRLYRLHPSEIQLGTLKLLPGTDLHQEPGMRFSNVTPYEVLQSDAMSPADLATVRRMASHWERIANRQHFPSALAALLPDNSPWQRFNRFSQRLAHQHGLFGFGIVETASILLQSLTDDARIPPQTARGLLRKDYLNGHRRMHLPAFLRD